MIYVNERPIDWPEDLAEREASWELDTPTVAPELFAFDSLAVAATEYVAAEVRVEPFWRAMLGIVGVFVTAIGFCAWVAIGQQ
jgi:hypothetical protein